MNRRILLSVVFLVIGLSSCGPEHQKITQLHHSGNIGSNESSKGCTVEASSTSSANTDLGTGGAVVCMAAGTYSGFTVTAKPTSVSTLKAKPGAHVKFTSGITVATSKITLSQMFIEGGVQIWESSTEKSLVEDTVEHNDIGPTNGYGIGVFCKTSTPCEHIKLLWNEIHNTSTTGEGDALRADGWKHMEIIGNDIYNIAECAAETCHTDTFQSYQAEVATEDLLIEKNYVHDCSSAQGFPFLKDGDISNVRIIDNLSLRMASKNQITGHWIDENIHGLVLHNNTYQGTSGSVIQADGSASNPTAEINHNVYDVFRIHAGGSGHPYSVTEDYDIFTGETEGFTLGAHSKHESKPAFVNTAENNYELSSNPNGIGVDWKPSEMHYGPTGE